MTLQVKPDHYSEGNVPVFCPNPNQFADFYGYLKSINPYGMESGIVKIIPPDQWVESLPELTTEKLQAIKIRNPIIQNMSGAKGVFVSENMEKHRTFNLPEWKHISMMTNHRPPVPRGQTRRASSDSLVSSKGLDKSFLFENFDYDIDASEFTVERCEFLEKNYWKTLGYAHPMYGADCLGSIFDDSVTCWNVSKLPNLLDYLDQQIPGVNDAYLYAGLWKASFAWHLEDQDLHSINFIHFGAPKQWYSIPQDHHERFYKLMADTFPENYKECKEFLRHKTFVVSPQFLESKGIKVNTVRHHKNEFIVTFPYGYHAGFNYDYNLAESVNFALEDWLPIGLKANKCECVSDSVGINMKQMIINIRDKTGNKFNLDEVLKDTDLKLLSDDPKQISSQLTQIPSPLSQETSTQESQPKSLKKTHKRKTSLKSHISSPDQPVKRQKTDMVSV